MRRTFGLVAATTGSSSDVVGPFSAGGNASFSREIAGRGGFELKKGRRRKRDGRKRWNFSAFLHVFCRVTAAAMVVSRSEAMKEGGELAGSVHFAKNFYEELCRHKRQRKKYFCVGQTRQQHDTAKTGSSFDAFGFCCMHYTHTWAPLFL